MRLSLRQALVLLLAAPLLAVSAVLGTSAYLGARFAVDDLGSQVIAQAAGRIDQQVQALLDVATAQSELDARLIESGRLDPADHEGMTAYFLEALRTHDELSYLSFGREDGAYWHVFRDGEGRLSVQWLLPREDGTRDLVDFEPLPGGGLRETSRDRDTARTPPRERPYYRAAVQAGRPTWPETYIFLSAGGAFDIPGASRATPVYDDDGALVGVLTSDFDLNALSRFLEGVRVGDAGLAFVLEMREDGTRRLIAHPDAPGELELTAPAADGRGREALPAEAIDDPRVGALLARLPVDADAMPTTVRRVAFEVGGRAYVGGYHRLGGDDRPRWVVAMVVPEAEILGPVQRLNRTTLVVGAVGLLLALALGLLVAHRLAGRLGRIAEGTGDIAGFRLEPRPVVESRIREIDRLGHALEETKAGLRSFQKFVPADLVRTILASGKEARLGGERRRITIYFSDIADFTAIAEHLAPEVLVELLADYLGEMTAEMLRAGGTVDKYIGDAIMAFWGAPEPREDQALVACRTALANQRTLSLLRRRWLAAGHPPVRARIGLHTGEALVGNFGSEDRLDYTAIGDAVNLASRLEGLNKVYGTEILVSDVVQEEVRERMVMRPVDHVTVKGRQQGAMVYELVGEIGDVDEATQEIIEAYASALGHLFAARHDEAIAGFEAVLARRPDDGPSRHMLARARRERDAAG